MEELTMPRSTPAPGLIRALCRVMFLKGLPVLDEIFDNPETSTADKVNIFNLWGRYGLGYADQASVHIHGDEGSRVSGVVRLPELDLPKLAPVAGPNDEPDELIDGGHEQGSEGDPRELFVSRLKKSA